MCGDFGWINCCKCNYRTFASFFDFHILKIIHKNTKTWMNTNFLNSYNLLWVWQFLKCGNTRKKQGVFGQTHVKIKHWNALKVCQNMKLTHPLYHLRSLSVETMKIGWLSCLSQKIYKQLQALSSSIKKLNPQNQECKSGRVKKFRFIKFQKRI